MTETHAEFLADVQTTIPAVRIVDEEIVTLGDISPGCRACHQGTWDCIFVTMGCNLACAFCCSPLNGPADYHGSAFGDTPDTILQYHAATHITGISFSGGEVFTQRTRLFNWIKTFRAARPDAYLWLYTNGTLIRADDLAQLADLRLDEMRFNLAATDYTRRKVLNTVRQAAAHIPAITVEIPTIPQHRTRLIEALPVWVDYGVKHLNLHELMHEPGTLAAQFPGERITYTLDDGHLAYINTASRGLIRDVMRQAYLDRLPLSVNACLLQTKIRQVRGRRHSLTPITQQPYERFDGTFFETVQIMQGEQVAFVHPDQVSADLAAQNDLQRRYRLAPMSIFQTTSWIDMQK
jgi:pyruvate formate-lyase activating enzyme-like uncharacterized protein